MAGTTGFILGAVACVVIFTVLAWAATGAVMVLLRKRRILDAPNERSSHTTPTPRGGGWGVLAVLLPGWLVIAALDGQRFRSMALIVSIACVLALIFWLDDLLLGLSIVVRILTQALAVIIAASSLLGDRLVFQGLLPPVLDTLVAGLLWLWFINLFNFMDGIDGISGVEAACVGIGLTAQWLLAGERGAFVLAPLAVTGVAIGFLLWNWHPAKVFLGDVGSVPLGFVLGWLLLDAASRGQWMAAAILPLYYLADATLTLLKRLFQGERFWEAHRKHFYQQAVRRGWSHGSVVTRILSANIVLVSLTVASSFIGSWALFAAAAVVVTLLAWMARARFSVA